jgi:26S proteasome regulatory subunit N5
MSNIFQAKNWDLLNENIIMLTKKRGQIKAAVTKMVQECAKWIFEGTIASKDEELKLIETLRTVTAGKIYVEVERARLTHKLAKMQENDGQIAKAAATMHELQVINFLSFCSFICIICEFCKC